MAHDGDLEKLVQQRVAQKLGRGGLGNEPRRLLDGTIFPLGTTRPSKGLGGVIHSRGDGGGYSLMRLVKSIMEKDKSVAPYEMDISQKLAQAGFQPSYGGVMVPLSGGD